MITHILDSSAWLAHIFEEPGGDEVTALFEDPETEIGISVLSLLEVHVQFRIKDRTDDFHEMVESYRPLFSRIIIANEPVILRAVNLREAASARLPAIDSMIAATAALQGAVLVHRDAHFLSIPDHLLTQEMLAAEL